MQASIRFAFQLLLLYTAKILENTQGYYKFNVIIFQYK